jgi:hypothetical protein
MQVHFYAQSAIVRIYHCIAQTKNNPRRRSGTKSVRCIFIAKFPGYLFSEDYPFHEFWWFS